MTSRHALAFVGLGLGLSTTMGQAHACKCAAAPVWTLELASIEGDGDATIEEAYWELEMWLEDHDGSTGSTYFNGKDGVEWRRLP